MLMTSNLSPTGLGHAGKEPLEGELAEAQPTQLELAHVAPGTTADAAPVPVTDLELRLAETLGDHGLAGHGILL